MRAEPPTPLKPLADEQARASDPAGDVWLSASAGTGKTHVLTARVLRLLLRPGVDPASILCLTFTKAGAAEMAERVQSRLARWVRLDANALSQELFALGEAHRDPETVARARTLFARVLEAPGGLRIGTIHAFAGQLLASFPVEAGLAPGFRPLDAREAAALAKRTLADLVVDAEDAGDVAAIAALQAMALRLGETGAADWLRRAAGRAAALDALPDPIGPYVRRQLDLPEGDVADLIAAECAAPPFDGEGLGRFCDACRAWGTATGAKHVAAVEGWLALPPEARGAALDRLAAAVLTAEGTPRKLSAKLLAHHPDVGPHAEALVAACLRLRQLTQAAATADLIAAGLDLGRRYARAYAAAKRAAGAVDFDDLIERVAMLLGTPGMGDWIRYTLDQTTDHILVDEGQDTNARQWAIVGALASDFFAGAGAKGRRMRTLFTVGDHKQAIFGFQGTDPLFFRAAEARFARLAEPAEDVDEVDRRDGLRRLSLSRSYRSAPPVLAVVDALIEGLGADAFGLDAPPPRHESAVGGLGAVELWPPVSIADAEEVGAVGDGESEEGWVDDATRRLATRLARQVAAWLRDPLKLHGKNRGLEPQDVMILVRRRGALASLIVARLQAEGVAVAGVDRLRLAAPLVVKDLLAAARFALQPDDSLALASLLVSPLIGWDQERLYAGAVRPAGVNLWRHLRGGAADAATLAALDLMLGRADLTTPYRFFEELLSGPLGGRRKLVARLGFEVNDPIDELLNAAQAFERTATPGLQRFLDWFDRDDVEIVRDPSAPLDAVRVMTVHGAKGLQAPLVVLADATVDPDRGPRRELDWAPDDDRDAVPIFRPRKAELFGPLAAVAEAADRREREEHWRLLYVAVTRAEERLVIAGALGPAARGETAPASWHRAMAAAMARLPTTVREDAIWGHVITHGAAPSTGARRGGGDEADAAPRPDWLDRPASIEARPARPLAPSAPEDDQTAVPPPGPAMRAAAERGRLIHALIERLPGIAPAERAGAAERWLLVSGAVADAAARRALIADVLRVIEDPRCAHVFAGDALAEAPIAAVVGGHVVAGTVDRLLVSDTCVTVVDFKTGRRPPATIAEAPVSHLRQMAAYAAALAAIFPERQIEAALLYTAGPTLLTIDDALLATHHPERLSTGVALPT